MTLSNIRTGLVTTIVDFGKWSGTEVSACDFGIMDSSASCVLLQPGPGTAIVAATYGTNTVRDKIRNWNIDGFVFIKDPGDATALRSNIWTAVDDIYNSVNSDDTLNGTSDGAMITTIGLRPEMLTDGTIDWAVIEFGVIAQEYEE